MVKCHCVFQRGDGGGQTAADRHRAGYGAARGLEQQHGQPHPRCNGTAASPSGHLVSGSLVTLYCFLVDVLPAVPNPCSFCGGNICLLKIIEAAVSCKNTR